MSDSSKDSPANSPSPMPDDVLVFWFGSSDLQQAPSAEVQRRWFKGGSAFDDEIRAQFGETVEAAISGEMDHWQEHPAGQLALILVCDQFTRNIFRGSAKAFAGDTRALTLTQAIIRDNAQCAFGLYQRAFLGMPLEHSELADVQRQSVAYFTQLREDYANKPGAGMAENFYRYAVAHQKVIDTFGRYPHRNVAIGRQSTAEEQEWLDAGGGF